MERTLPLASYLGSEGHILGHLAGGFVHLKHHDAIIFDAARLSLDRLLDTKSEARLWPLAVTSVLAGLLSEGVTTSV